MLSRFAVTLLVALTLVDHAVAVLKEVKPRDTYGCPGVVNIHGDDTSVCCVAGTVPPVILSTCKGWPICKGPPTTTVTKTPISCATIITYAVGNDKNPKYSSQLSEAKASLTQSGTHFRATLGASASAGASASSGPSASASAQGGSGTGSSGSGRLVVQLGLIGSVVLGLVILL